MPRQLAYSTIIRLLLAILIPALPLLSQSPEVTKAAKTSSPVTAEEAIELARLGRCREAIPPLKRAISGSSGTAAEMRKSAGFAGLRCALSLDDRDSTVAFIQLMRKHFPEDPDVMFVIVHAYSDLSTRTAQDLGRTAPKSIAAQKLNAEAWEMQGKWADAQRAYESMIAQDPKAPGLHFLLGRLLLSRPDAGPSDMERAKQEFQKELEIDPTNAGAHYILGELASRKENCEEAIPEFSQAAKLDPNFAEAYLGWGYCLVTLKRYEEAIVPLRVAERLTPDNGSVHFSLGTALGRTGQKEEAEKEFAIHRKLALTAAPPKAGTTPQ
jgi:tetratricopeptide (TPR) repeat protein